MKKSQESAIEKEGKESSYELHVTIILLTFKTNTRHENYAITDDVFLQVKL